MGFHSDRGKKRKTDIDESGGSPSLTARDRRVRLNSGSIRGVSRDPGQPLLYLELALAWLSCCPAVLMPRENTDD
jgi:hypothetical protein